MPVPVKTELLVDLLGKHEFQDEADAVGLIGSLSDQGARKIGYADKLLLARSLTFSGSIPNAVTEMFRASYDALKEAHEAHLSGAAADASRLLMQAPGLVTFNMIKGELPASGEAVKAIAVAPAQDKPYREASLTLVYGDDDKLLPPDSSFVVDFHPHKFPTHILEAISAAENED